MELQALHAAVLILAGIILLLAAASDARAFRIPNLASIALFLLFPAFIMTAPAGLLWIDHFAVFGIVFVFGYALYVKKYAGAGDIKLIAALSLWAGPTFIGPFLFVTAFAGGILSLGLGLQVLIQHKLSKSLEPLKLRKTPIPYGVAIAVGGLCTLALMSHQDLLVKV